VKVKYPIEGEWRKASTANYIGMAGRHARCGHLLGKNETFWRKETHVSWFRGEDIVDSRCASCHEKASVKGKL
jgi:hypothetical protein